MFIANEIFGTNKMLATNEVGSIKDGKKSIEKLIESKTRKLTKLEKLFKSQNLAKLRKKLSKSGNLPKF